MLKFKTNLLNLNTKNIKRSIFAARPLKFGSNLRVGKKCGDKIYRPRRRKFIDRYSPTVSVSNVPSSMLLIKETVAKRAAGKFMSVCGALGKSKTIAFFLSP